MRRIIMFLLCYIYYVMGTVNVQNIAYFFIRHRTHETSSHRTQYGERTQFCYKIRTVNGYIRPLYSYIKF